ncbi:probable E3 ubiquitin-protein ligase XBOS32 [Primulina eburnea]|uniref:probable E3 ubiquitin-protein ligase XBOS32 n=1 Tax=Primulina eburnea TaxID=1245227 RepID=UPI003C6C9FE0
MRFLRLVGKSFGCSASGERLVSAARDGDLQEAKALLDYNPRLARYSTFGVRNSPLHYSAAHGHNEIVALLLGSGVDINLRNYRGQTALMQASQCGHWEVVQTLILYKASIHRADYLNEATALHLAALNGHSQCIRLLLADYVPSNPNFCSMSSKRWKNDKSALDFDEGALHGVINRPADGGVTALHMSALNGHAETVHLLLDLGASVTNVTLEDGTTVDLIGSGSTPLHYAACGGNVQCCQLLISRGASLTTENANGWTPLMVARSWHKDWLEDTLSQRQEGQAKFSPSPYLCLPLMSIVEIARECGWRSNDSLLTCSDPCVVCLERKCTVAADDCFHEFCTHCALYLCSTNTTSTVAHGPPGSIPCPLCRHGIVSFTRLESTKPIMKEIARTSLSLPFCACVAEIPESISVETPFCKPDGAPCVPLSPFGSFRSLSCRRFHSLKLNPSLCMGSPDVSHSLVSRATDCSLQNQLLRCSRSSFRRSTSQNERRRWLCSFNRSVETGRG